MPDPWPLTAASRWPIVAAVTAAAIGAALLAGRGDGAVPPPPAPTAQVRAMLGSPDPGTGLQGVLEMRQSLLPGALARSAALPDASARGRFWVAAPDRWRMEIQGLGHDWQVVRAGDEIQLYDDARRRLITLPRDTLPAGLADVGPTRVAQGEPTTVAGRPAWVLRYDPVGRDVLLRRVEVSVDSKTGVPLALSVYARGRATPVVRVRATSASERRVPLSRVALDPPRGATRVPAGLLLSAAGAAGVELGTVGTGWERVIVAGGGIGRIAGADEGPGGARVLSTPLASLVSAERGGEAVTAAGLLPPDRVIAAAAEGTR